MATQIEGNIRTFTAGEALEAFRRVKLSSGNVVAAGAGEAFIGVTQQKVASGEAVPVALKNTGRTFLMTASAAISSGASVYGSASGKVSTTVSGSIQGTALEAASADGSVIEVLPA